MNARQPASIHSTPSPFAPTSIEAGASRLATWHRQSLRTGFLRPTAPNLLQLARLSHFRRLAVCTIATNVVLPEPPWQPIGRLLRRLRFVESAVEPTRSVNITVSWRRSASSRRVSLDSMGAEGAVTAIETLPRSRIARSILRRSPSKTPSFSRSWSVRSGRTLRSTRFSTNRWAYSDMPSFLSQSAICCIAVTQFRSRPVWLWTTATESLHQKRLRKNVFRIRAIHQRRSSNNCKDKHKPYMITFGTA
jgi:hypothetical protein